MRADVLIVCQAGPGIGLGHLARMGVAARALRQHAGLAAEMMIQGPPLAHDALTGLPHRFIAADDGLWTAIDAALAAPRSRAPILLLDLAPARVAPGLADALRRWRSAGVRCIAIDGLADLRPLLDGIYLPSFRLSPPLAGAPTKTPGQAPVRHGWDCLLLPPPAPRDARPAADLLVLTGGADATGLGAHWPQAIDAALPAGTRVHWVRGPYAPPPRLPEPALQRLDWTLHEAPPHLGGLMRSCRLAVTVFGVSCFELMAVGVPTVVFSPYGDKDAAELAELDGLGLLAVVDGPQAALPRLGQLLTDADAAQALGRRAAERLAGADGRALAEFVTGIVAGQTAGAG